jgi:hypothetical protein
VAVDALETDRATLNGVDKLYRALANGRRVDALLANAGRGLGNAFLDQNFSKCGVSSTSTLPGHSTWCTKSGDKQNRHCHWVLVQRAR